MRNRRRSKLVEPSLQLRFGIAFAGVGLSAVLLHTVLLHTTLTEVVDRSGPAAVLENAPRLLMLNAVACAAIVLPMAVVVGALALFPIAGPLYRIEKHLRRFLDGSDPGMIELRRGDRLVRLASLINRVLAKVRRGDVPAMESAGEEPVAEERSAPEPPAPLPSEPEYEDTPEYLS